jgi:Flp pilus assembly pilin Flp
MALLLRLSMPQCKEALMTSYLGQLCVHTKIALRSTRKGQSMAEYSLIVAAIAILVFAAYTSTGQAVTNLVSWGAIANDLLGS